jgi:hypothetical protein
VSSSVPVIEGVEPEFAVAKLEGDAVFAVAAATDLDDHGDETLARLPGDLRALPRATRRSELETREITVCDACPVVATLDLKMVLHRGGSCDSDRIPGRAARTRRQHRPPAAEEQRVTRTLAIAPTC